MKHKELAKVGKAAWEISQHTKTTIAQNIVLATNRGDLKIDKNVLPKLIALLNATVDQAYGQALKQFEKTVEKSLDEATAMTALETKKN